MRSTLLLPAILSLVATSPAAHDRIEAAAGGPPACDATPIDSLPFVIDQPGRYCLTKNFVFAEDGAVAIGVLAGPVDIDFNGFHLRGVGGARHAVESTFGNLTVRNGTVSGFASNGMNVGHNGRVIEMNVIGAGGTGASIGRGSTVLRCRFTGNARGVVLGWRSLMKDCLVEGTDEGEIAVFAGEESHIESVVVREGRLGIQVIERGRVVDCTVSEFVETGICIGSNAGDGAVRGCIVSTTAPDALVGIDCLGSNGRIADCSVRGAAVGIRAEGSALVQDCTVTGSTLGIELHGASSRVRDCTVNECGAEGIVSSAVDVEIRHTTVSACQSTGIDLSGDGSAVRECSATRNGGDGIRLGGGSLALGNLCRGNAGSGLRGTGGSNRVQDNVLDANAVGLTLDSHDNLVIGNRATQNASADFSVAYPNAIGRILAVPYWIPTSNPQANFSRSPF